MRGGALRLAAAALLGLLGTASAQACTAPPPQNPVAGSKVGVPAGNALRRGTIFQAFYEDLTDRYAHGVLGDALEPVTLVAQTIIAAGDCPVSLRVSLGPPHVFEDVAPRLYDLDGDGSVEVIAVRSHENKGAQLVVYGLDEARGRLKLVAETPYIGTRNRWLAPLGAADLDGDGRAELAYIDRPHLAKTLRIWRYEDGTLTQVAALPGLTNHRIGEPDIAGGIRTCGAAPESIPEMILATGNWSELQAVRWDGQNFVLQSLGTDTSRAAFNRAMACE